MKNIRKMTPYRQKKLDERDNLIFTLYKQGMPFRNIGLVVGLTYGRVNQIIQKMKFKDAVDKST